MKTIWCIGQSKTQVYYRQRVESKVQCCKGLDANIAKTMELTLRQKTSSRLLIRMTERQKTQIDQDSQDGHASTTNTYTCKQFARAGVTKEEAEAFTTNP